LGVGFKNTNKYYFNSNFNASLQGDSAISFRVAIATGLVAVGGLIGSLATYLISQTFGRQMSDLVCVENCQIFSNLKKICLKVTI
jgi:hypothetical protein